ncbi:hypothetical protein [Pseudonocardia asaccharolytica]|uniref:Uncharacterized protein n=1 Tax=Pseudonocardia asaccharolytica DSM 44247 = NBRC 16224 TaxID=1123024 RepID=A0A511D6U1_9PSEU|nr:hypothetical protein [Pseudonocardia asaccharolytica]GEL19324.1 hypothetical protein PA7_31610 [Pseudonocardia asaccharolytica DSM 44247 = NBRC 16224]
MHPYFTAKAREVLRRGGGDPDHAGPLAAWAEQVRPSGDSRLGVVVAHDGRIVAHTRHAPARVSASYIQAVADDDGDHLVGREVGLAISALSRRHGPCIHVHFSQVCQGPGTP